MRLSAHVRRRCSSVVIFMMFLALPAWAHHSHGNYDLSKWEMMQGTVKQVVFIVPHSIVYLDVKDAKGETTMWALEGTGGRGGRPGSMRR